MKMKLVRYNVKIEIPDGRTDQNVIYNLEL